MTIDFDRLQQRILPVPGVSSRQYSQLKAGLPGSVFFLEAPRDAGARGNILHRYRLTERKADVFLNNVSTTYSISADGKKLVYRNPAPQPPARGRGAAERSQPIFLVDTDKAPPTGGQGRLDVTLRMLLDPKAEFTQIFNEGWRLQRDYLYVPNMQAPTGRA